MKRVRVVPEGLLHDLTFYEVNEPTGCWLWLRHIDKDGYGRWGSDCAHRVFFILAFGQPAPGLEIDHLCKRRECVNPEHLEAVTHRENLDRIHEAVRKRQPKRAVGYGRRCREGHLIAGGNAARRNRDGKETYICRICRLAADERHRQRRKENA